MVRCTARRGDASPASRVSPVASSLGGDYPVFSQTRLPTPTPPHPLTHPLRTALWAVGEPRKPQQERGGGHGDTAGPVTLYSVFELFLTSGFQEIENRGKEKDKGKEETLRPPLPSIAPPPELAGGSGSPQTCRLRPEAPGWLRAEMLGRQEGPSGAGTTLTAGSQGLAMPPGSRVTGLFNPTLHVGKLRQGGGECPHSHTVGQWQGQGARNQSDHPRSG